jgi:hypothetical protein
VNAQRQHPRQLLWFALIAPALVLASQEPIRLPLTFVQSTPVTTITVGGKPVQAIVDSSAGDADGALTLSKEIIENAGGIALGKAAMRDAFGHEFAPLRFEMPVVTIDGHTFRNVRVVQALRAANGEAPPVPNVIGKYFLSDYFVVVDYAHALVTLWPPDTSDPAGIDCGRVRIPMERTEEARLVVSEFTTDAGHLRLAWSTATTFSMLSQTIADRLKLPTVLRGPNSPRFYQPRALLAAGQDFGPSEFVVLPLSLPPDFEGLLGSDFFHRHTVCFDYRRRLIRVAIAP